MTIYSGVSNFVDINVRDFDQPWPVQMTTPQAVGCRLSTTIVPFTLSLAKLRLSLKMPLAAPQASEGFSAHQILRKLQWRTFSETDYSPSHKHWGQNPTTKQVSDIKQLFPPISESISLAKARNHQILRLYLCRCNTEPHVEVPSKYRKFWQNWS